MGRIIPAEKVRLVVSPPCNDVAHEAVGTTLGTTGTTPEPEVVLVKDGERVKSIVIKCGCGQVITLDCEYGAGKELAS